MKINKLTITKTVEIPEIELTPQQEETFRRDACAIMEAEIYRAFGVTPEQVADVARYNVIKAPVPPRRIFGFLSPDIVS